MQFSGERLAKALSGVTAISRIEYLPTVGSTNDVAKQLGVDGVPEIALVVADAQTAGRGRLAREWWSPPGTAIAMSFLLRPRVPPALAYRLTMLAGLAAAEAVEQVSGLRVGLKWPNDVVIERTAAGGQPSVGLKLGGILTETSISGHDIEFAAVGLGLNVNVDFSSRPDLPEATSLMLQLGRRVDRLELARALAAQLAVRYAALDEGEKLRGDWSARLTTVGRQIVARRGEETIAGLAQAVDETGALLILTDDGMLRRVDAADVTLRTPNP